MASPKKHKHAAAENIETPPQPKPELPPKPAPGPVSAKVDYYEPLITDASILLNELFLPGEAPGGVACRTAVLKLARNPNLKAQLVSLIDHSLI